MKKSAERLAFEADRQRLRLEGRLLMRQILNEMEHELETIHYNANQSGYIPRVTLEPSDVATIESGARKLMGVLQIEEHTA
jgi:hypothetical protein